MASGTLLIKFSGTNFSSLGCLFDKVYHFSLVFDINLSQPFDVNLAIFVLFQLKVRTAPEHVD